VGRAARSRTGRRLAGHFEIVTSPALLDELRRVLSYPKLQAVIGDPDDDRLIEAALAANADVIVTGDQDLLTLGHIGQIQVRTPREFLESFSPGT
jgi:predicted nucleic acid-binding protein